MTSTRDATAARPATPRTASQPAPARISKQEKAQRIIQILNQLHPEPGIPLDHVDPFTLLVAVVLSAQTTDKKVNQVTPKLFEVAPTASAMARMSVDEIREIIREVGLAPQKAKALKGLSELIIDEHGGQVPTTLDALERLPGVGHKTAQVVIAQAFGVPAFPVDTHIHRLAARWGLSSGKNVEETERDLKAVFAVEDWNRVHIQIILFGRAHCPALRHDFAACPICAWAASPRRADEEARARVKAKAKTEKVKTPVEPKKAATARTRRATQAKRARKKRIG